MKESTHVPVPSRPRSTQAASEAWDELSRYVAASRDGLAKPMPTRLPRRCG